MNRRSYFTLSTSLFFFCAHAWATDIALQGVTASRALIAVDGGKPHWFTVGESYAGITVRAIDGKSITVEADGQRQIFTFGDDDGKLGGNAANADAQQVTLHASEGGHFRTTGTINGASVQFLVDTGASTIAINSADAQRIGIDYTKGERIVGSTASGAVYAYRVKLDTVSIGGVTLNNVDGAVLPGNSPTEVLLGMSFLNRMEMQRDGDTMTLKKRY